MCNLYVLFDEVVPITTLECLNLNILSSYILHSASCVIGVVRIICYT